MSKIHLGQQTQGLLPDVQGGSNNNEYYNFAPIITTAPITASILNTVTLPQVPFGVNASDLLHYVYILDTLGGTSEAVLISGGTAVSGGFNQTITFTPAFSHVAGVSIISATAGIQEAIIALAATGGRVIVTAGVKTLYQTLSIGNGIVLIDSTLQNVRIRGTGKGSAASGATTLLWNGPAGGTMVSIAGPIRGAECSHLRFNGNSTAGKFLQVYASDGGNYEWNNYIGLQPGIGAVAIQIECGGGFNANSRHNSFDHSQIDASASGASGIKIGTIPANFNSGNFENTFNNILCVYANDTATSYGIQLGWADNNTFAGSEYLANPVNVPGLGSALNQVRQAGAAYNFLPSENTFVRVALGGSPLVTAISGNAGTGIGNVFWPWETFDSGGIPNVQNVRGWISDGDLFDASSPVGRMGCQNIFTIYSRLAQGLIRVLGFMGSSGTGTIQTTGTAVVGTSTSFTTQLAVGKAILGNSNEIRYVTVITDNTHATLNAAFNDDLPAGSGFLYQTGAYGFLFSDGNTVNVGAQDASDLRLWTAGVVNARLDISGNFNVSARLTGAGTDVSVSNAGGNTIAAANLINGIYVRAGGGAQTDTTDTAANIVAAIPNCQVGSEFIFNLYNNSGGLHTLGLGSGVTAHTGLTPTLTTTALNFHQFTFRVTNVGTPAVVVLSNGQSAY